MTTTNTLFKAAEQIRTAYEQQKACKPVRDLFGSVDVEAAYTAQDLNDKHWQHNGRRLVGRKIALTNKIVQQQFGVPQPCYGSLYADMLIADGLKINRKATTQQRLEMEVAIVLAEDLTGPVNSIVDIINACAYALPAFEIVDSRIINWDINACDFITDNTSASLVVLGTKPVALSDFDIARCRAITRTQHETVSEGSGNACLGNPLNALRWLADELVRAGKPLRAGEVVITGALGPVIPINSPASFEAEIEGLGKVSTTFAQ